MLQPTETDLLTLFLVLVVLPLVTYFLLGKWTDTTKKKERISYLAQLAAEESLKAEAMSAASVISLIPLPKNGLHECARCYGPALTRCSRCKSVRYCSGKCQIIHWRLVHKQECQQLEISSGSSSPRFSLADESVDERVLLAGNMDSMSFTCNLKQPLHEKSPYDDVIQSLPTIPSTDSSGGCSMMERRSLDKHVSQKSNREMLRSVDGNVLGFSDTVISGSATCYPSSNIADLKGYYGRQKRKEGDSVLPEEENLRKHNINKPGSVGNGLTRINSAHEGCKSQSQDENAYSWGTTFGASTLPSSAKHGSNVCEIETGQMDGRTLPMERITTEEEVKENCYSEWSLMKKSNRVKGVSHSSMTKMCKSSKSTMRTSREQQGSDMERKVRDTTPAQESNGVGMGIMKMMEVMKTSKIERQEPENVDCGRHKKTKMLFPYEEFVKFFQYEVLDLSPKGLMNCGNSCYANAVLQCLTSTKPLTIYLLHRSHSRSRCMKDWCLMCELEQHVMMLRNSGGPLSPGRILSRMQSINCHIGNGSQEDAHEFLRLLVTSMQSICLEGLGGENVVDPRLQETTFIQHTFGGRLKSKVKCLRCHHESERDENIMDLTLEIYGWVESLEDALTQFTSPEDLDGENMYRCGRCAAYVRARKQLSIQEAPNILTIVLKRFQEGSYGKINKCITFPDMLDMVPFMSGAEDIPPLYMLYAVVVHLDTLNASFSGHYVSYVKDMQGNWFRIDDTEVQPVPMSQVMSEGAYILFYMRSWPRPATVSYGKTARHHGPGVAKAAKPSLKPKQTSSSCHCGGPGPCLVHKTEKCAGLSSHPSNGLLKSANRNSRQSMAETYAEAMNMEFSDATSSDWSIFTSSDEASFTTESTRDSFSTVDYADGCNIDPILSIFHTSYVPDYSKTVLRSAFSSSKPQTRFDPGQSCLVVESSYPPVEPPKSLWKRENSKQGVPLARSSLPTETNHGVHAKCRSISKQGPCQTSGHCII